MRTRTLAFLLLLVAGPATLFAVGARGQAAPLPEDVVLERDIAYGPDPAQRLDVYRPRAEGGDRPLVLMVHGGGWRIGDKAARGVAAAKAAAWVPAGGVFVSINYRMLPAHDAYAQREDVARALAFVQAHARDWGADPRRVVLMGHSAGAHLVALLSADPAQARAFGAGPWLGTVVLDSAALDVPALMARRHLPLHDAAFGADPARWRIASPRQALSRDAVPMLLVCSSQRRDRPCDTARDFAAAAARLGTDARVLPQDLDHADVNAELGRPGAYTEAVNAFLAQVGAALPGNRR
jgi:acetyl esterase/lipase